MEIDYAKYEYTLAVVQVILAMLGMGTTLTVQDFWNIVRHPFGIALILTFQFLLFPFVAFSMGRFLSLPDGVAVGLILVTSVPSGSISNILTLLGRGNIPLSITATTASTLMCLLTTPLILRFYALQYLPDEFEMPTGLILGQISMCLLIPLSIGMLVCRFSPASREHISKWMIRGSLVALALLVVGSLGSGRIQLNEYDWQVPVSIVVLGILTAIVVDQLAQRLSLPRDESFTAAIEVTVRNTNLAVLLKASLFPAASAMDALGNQVLFVALFYGGASLVISTVPIIQRRRKTNRLAA